jgi:hypothetical protein
VIYKGNYASFVTQSAGGQLFATISTRQKGYMHLSSNLIVQALDYGTPAHNFAPQWKYIGQLTEGEANVDKQQFLESKVGLVVDGPSIGACLIAQVNLKFETLFMKSFCFTNGLIAIGEDRLLVPIWHAAMRSGTKGSEFVFALVDHRGNVIGRLEGLDKWDDSPYTDWHLTCCFLPNLNLIVHKNKFGFYVFDVHGALLSRVSLQEGELKPLSHFKLVGSQSGKVILHHPKNHCLLILDGMALEQDLAQGLRVALEEYNRALKALKKQAAPVSYRWLNAQNVTVL